MDSMLYMMYVDVWASSNCLAKNGVEKDYAIIGDVNIFAILQDSAGTGKADQTLPNIFSSLQEGS